MCPFIPDSRQIYCPAIDEAHKRHRSPQLVIRRKRASPRRLDWQGQANILFYRTFRFVKKDVRHNPVMPQSSVPLA
jgi:hypothetical protein